MNIINSWYYINFNWDKHIMGSVLFGIELLVTQSLHIVYSWLQSTLMHKNIIIISEKNKPM